MIMKKLVRILLLVSLFLMGTQWAIAANTSKILYDNSQKTAVFVYDDVTYSVGSTFTSYGVTYTVSQIVSKPRYASGLETVVFDESYAECRPTSMYEMFYNCTKLSRFIHMENLNTSEVTNMQSMFYRCSSLETIDLSHFDTSNVTSMNDMFNGCSSLETIDLRCGIEKR